MFTPGKPGVDQVGNSQYSINVTVPPGTAGMQPSLGLAYSSSEGDGPAGVGLAVTGLSAIQRCPGIRATDGAPEGIKLAATDKFCLDGQRLVNLSGTYGADGVEHRTEVESFTKVIPYGTAGTGPAWFKAWTKSGFIMEYGNTADSRIEALGSSTPRAWALNKVSDRNGNYYTVSYTEDAVTGEYLVSRIDYTGNSAASLTPYNSVQFVYETRPDDAMYFIGPAKVTSTKRLTKVQTWADTTLVREYRFAYELSPTSLRSRAVSVTECAGDGTCLPATAFAWRDAAGGLTQTGATAAAVGSSTAYADTVLEIKRGDFNKDGFEDTWVLMTTGAKLCYGPTFATCKSIAVPSGSKVLDGDFDGDLNRDILVQLPDGQLRFCMGGVNQGYPYDVTLCPGPIPGWFSAWKVMVGDFNGDGRTDLYMHNGPTGYYCDGGASYASNSAICNYGAHPGLTGFEGHVGDFDGDGREDIFFVSSGATSFCSGKALSENSVACQTVTGASTWKDAFIVRPGDFNGDGTKDILLVGASGSQVCHGPGIAAANNCIFMTGTDWKTGRRAFVADYNGDGVSDVMLVASSGTKFCPGPNLLEADACVTSSTADWSTAPVAAGDFDGTGTADLFLVQGQQGYLAAGGSGVTDLLASVTTGLGAVTSFTYKPLSDTAVYGLQGSTNDYFQPTTTQPYNVVYEACASNGIGGTNCNRHFYARGRFNLDGRGFVGFESTKVTDLVTGRITSTRRGQSFPTIGVTSLVEVLTGGTNHYESRTYQLIEVIGGRTAPVMTEQFQVVNGLEGQWKFHRTALTYDAVGNVTNETLYVNENYDVWRQATQHCYSYDIANWLLMRETCNNVTSYTSDGSLPSRITVSGSNYVAGTNRVWRSSSPGGFYTDYTHDSFGNVLTTVLQGADITSGTFSQTYDAKGRFVTSTTNPLNHTATMAYDGRFGVQTSNADPNNLTVTWGYDSFGRKILESRPDGTQSVFTYALCAGCVTTASNAAAAYYVTQQSTGSSQPSYEYFDTLARPIGTARRNFADTDWLDEKVVHYSASSRVARKYLPHFRNGTDKPYTAITYDALGNVATETAPDGGVTTTAYIGGVGKQVTNAKSQVTTAAFDYRGLVNSVKDAQNNTLTFGYDTQGNQTSITDPNGNVISYTYNFVGKKLSMTDPNQGSWSYSYNVLGEMLTQTDANNVTTTFTYDKLGRRLTQSVTGFSSTWAYDTGTKGIGKVASVTSANGVSHNYAYDTLGRLSSHTQVVDGQSYAEGRTYDSAGRLTTLTYPTGFAVNYVYSALGYQTEIRNAATSALIWKVDALSAAGITDETYGNGTGVTRDYQSQTYRENRISHVRDSDNALLQRWEYSFDLLGNTTQRKETFGNVTEDYSYDNLNRLTNAVQSGGASKQYAFDVLGNLTQKTDFIPLSSPNNAYQYQGTKPHAVSVTSGSNGQNPLPTNYYYDANGNATNWHHGETVSYTAFSMPSQITKGGGSYAWTYDAAYKRVKYVTPSKTTIYLQGKGISNIYQKVTLSGGDVQHRHVVWARDGKQVVAQVTTTVSGAVQTTQTHYLHTDKLRSLTLITDESAQSVERFYFDAFGKRRNANGSDAAPGTLTSTVTSMGYTGHENLDELNLVHMNGRVYDPYLAKFLQADPIEQSSRGLQMLNRYGYVGNNPLMYTDPSGYEAEAEEAEDPRATCVYKGGGVVCTLNEREEEDPCPRCGRWNASSGFSRISSGSVGDRDSRVGREVGDDSSTGQESQPDDSTRLSRFRSRINMSLSRLACNIAGSINRVGADFGTVGIGVIGIGVELNIDQFGNVFLGVGVGLPALPPRGAGLGTLGPRGPNESNSEREGRINNLLAGLGAAARSPIGGIAVSSTEVGAVIGTPAAGGGYNWLAGNACR